VVVLGFLPVVIRDWERLVSKDRAYEWSVNWYKVITKIRILQAPRTSNGKFLANKLRLNTFTAKDRLPKAILRAAGANFSYERTFYRHWGQCHAPVGHRA
jgi:hypothetical protein